MNAILKGFATEGMSVSIGIDMGVFEHGENTFFQESKLTASTLFSMAGLLDGFEISWPNIRTKTAVVGFTWWCVVTPISQPVPF